MDEARLPFTMTATVADAAAPPTEGEAAAEQLSIDWVRIPVSLEVTLPPEAMQGARRDGSSAASGRDTGTSGPAAPRPLRPGTATPPDGGRTSGDGPSPAGAPRLGRDGRRPIGTGALNSLGLAATFGPRAANQPLGPASLDTIGSPSPPTPPTTATPDGPAADANRPTPGTGQTNAQTNGTTGSRALDVVFKAGKIGTLHRAAATGRDGRPG